MISALLALFAAAPELACNRTSALPADRKAALEVAASCLAHRTLTLAEAKIDQKILRHLANKPKKEPWTRWVRETTGRPVDVEDFLLLLDDLCEQADQLGPQIYIPASRARAYGILLHPQEVFSEKPRLYGTYGAIPLDDPPSQIGLLPAKDHSPPSPAWTARYQQPEPDEGKIAELIEENPRFGRATQSLFRQLKAQGAFTWIEAAVRPRERGFLIYASWWLSRAPSPQVLQKRVRTLDRYERTWGLSIPITWHHPDGFEATVEGARAMADTYGVDYATVRGARRSSHYGGKAVDIVAVDLPRALKLRAPDGEERTFDLSGDEASRDLSLSPELIVWIEAHFNMRKLKRDYPHWSDGHVRTSKKR